MTSGFQLLCLATFCCGLSYAIPPVQPEVSSTSALLGPKECLNSSYWCRNFTTARQCNANRFCIRAVWEHQVLPPDNGEICEKCKEMVAEARAELQSNETQENIKLVLEGSCMILIPIKVLAHECVKAVDQVIPELIEALESQMNPQMVCSVAGLCNSERIDQMLAAYKAQSSENNQKLNCENCNVVAGMADRNFRVASRDSVLDAMLEVCGRMGSFSDGCAATVIVHFNTLYEHLASHLSPEGVCHLAGVCSQRYHDHSTVVEIKPVPKLEGDMPCELCEQLVQHLRDILVANTTEKEFEQVLLGICSQTGNFKKECVDLVETYYPFIYKMLKEGLDGKVICTQIGICPKTNSFTSPLYPLLPAHVAQTLQKTPSGLHRVPVATSGVSVHSGSHSLQVADSQLPLDSLVLLPGDKDLCQMCEYFLHFLQNELTNPINEQAIIKKAEKACDGLPDKFAPTCRSFVDTYSTAVIALLAQDIDPSQVCPKIGVCPGWSAELQPACEPCKVTALHLATTVGSNTSEANIHEQQRTLCLSLPFEESRHCSRILAAHSEDLTDMVTAEFTNEEMCFFMKYCSVSSVESSTKVGGDIATNEIGTSSMEDEKRDNELCVLCEFVMKTLEKDLQKNSTEEEIRIALEHVCLAMPKTVRPKCKQFVDQYINLIVTLLAESADPQKICTMVNLCSNPQLNLDYVQKTVSKCIVCESLMGALIGVMEDRDITRNLNHQLELACLRLPKNIRSECQEVVRQLAPQIEGILRELPVGPLVCAKLQLCGRSASVDLIGENRCVEGQTYWCLSTVHAATCQKIEHCQKNVWMADKPNKTKKLRAKKFIY